MSTGTPEDQTPTAFGAVNDADIDFGTPALDSDAESFYTSDGFAAQVEASAADRITPDHLFAQPLTPQPPTPVAPVAPGSVPPFAAQPPVQPVAPGPVPPVAPVPPFAAQPVAPVPPVPPVAPVAPVPAGPFGASGEMEFAIPAQPVRAKRSKRSKRSKRTRIRGKRKVLAPVAAATVVALGAGAAFAAYQFGVFGAPGDQPAVAVPGTAFAYAAVDFNPSAKEKVGAYQLAKKFPSAKVTSKDSIKDDLLKNLFSDLPGINYATDIKPWVGDRAAIAAVPAPGTNDGVTPLAVIAYTDKAKAQAGLAKIKKAALTQVNAATGQTITNDGTTTVTSLADGVTLESDPNTPAAIPERQATVAYAFKGNYVLIADNAKELDAAVAAKTTLDKDPTFTHDMNALGADQFARAWVNGKALVAALPKDADLPPTFTDRFTGTLAVAAHAAGDYLEVTGKTFNMKAAADATSHQVHLVHNLPGEANVAFEGTGIGQSLATAWDAYKDNDPFGIAEQAPKAGLTLPDDLTNIFGTDFAIAAHITKSDANVLVQAETPNPAASKTVLDRLGALDPSAPVTTQTTSTGYVSTTDTKGDWLKDALNSGGALGQTDPFTKAVPHAETSDAYLYLHVADLFDEFKVTDEQDLARLDAIGLSATSHGPDGEFTLRVTLR